MCLGIGSQSFSMRTEQRAPYATVGRGGDGRSGDHHILRVAVDDD